MVSNLKNEPVRELHTERVSDTVSFRYYTEDGRRSEEGLVASGRWYPAIRGASRFLFGLRCGNLFVPGMLWCDTFIPGLVTQRAFVPGIVLGEQFVPGIVASCVLVPGIVQGSRFVPGVVERRRFLPGAFTSDGKFSPGLIENGGFSAGVITEEGFRPIPPERIPPGDLDRLSQDGYGFELIRRFESVGGVPVAGAVLAIYRDTGLFVHSGFLTDEFAVLGGLRPGQALTEIDPRQRLSDALRHMGIDLGDGDDPAAGLHGGDTAQQRIEQMAKDFENGGLFGTGVGAWQSGGVPAECLGQAAEALDGMNQGANAMMDHINQQWKDYWEGVMDAGQGAISLSGNIRSLIIDAGRDELGKGIGGQNSGGKALITLGEVAAGALGGAVAGAEFGPIGMAIGAILGWASAVYEITNKAQDSQPPKGGGSEPGDDGGDSNQIVTGGGTHPRPLGPYIVYRTQLIQVNRGEYDMSTFPSVSTQDPVVKVVVTDTGAVMILNYNALRKYAASHAPEGGTLKVNLLTGETETWHLGNVQVAVGEDAEVPYWIRFVARPQH